MTSPPLPTQHEPAAPLPVRMAGPGRGEIVRTGVRCGLFVAAATAGVLTGFSLGNPAGPLAPFTTSGRMLLGVSLSDGRARQIASLVGGLALHTLVAVGWGVLFALIAGSLRGVRSWVAAALFAVTAYMISEYLLPPALRLGHAAHPFPPQLALLYAVLALALVIGMRLANSWGVGAARIGSPGTR